MVGKEHETDGKAWFICSYEARFSISRTQVENRKRKEIRIYTHLKKTAWVCISVGAGEVIQPNSHMEMLFTEAPGGCSAKRHAWEWFVKTGGCHSQLENSKM